MNRVEQFARKGWAKFRWYTSGPGINQISLRIKHFGFAVECPYCDWRGRKFFPHSEPHPRPNAVCPRCYSKERHRLLLLYLKRRLGLDNRTLTVLEIAPGLYSIRYFASLPYVTYVSVDIESPLAMGLADIGYLPFSAAIFDLVICYHVLEHIADDRGAMAELYRVLKRDGTMLVQVPVVHDVTDEDPLVVDPQERLKRFGQDDHVRAYGLDFYDRLREVGFAVHQDDFASRLPQDEIRRYGLVSSELITICTRPLIG